MQHIFLKEKNNFLFSRFAKKKKVGNAKENYSFRDSLNFFLKNLVCAFKFAKNIFYANFCCFQDLVGFANGWKKVRKHSNFNDEHRKAFLVEILQLFFFFQVKH